MNKKMKKASNFGLIRQLLKCKLLLLFLLYSFTGLGANFKSQQRFAAPLQKASAKEVYQTITEQSKLHKKTISGKVSDSNGEPLPGVTVIVKGTTNGVITNIDGAYELQVAPSAKLLHFSFIGMKAQDIEISGRSAIDVVMEEETIGLEELVVIGYGTQKKENLTGAVDQVSAEVLKNSPVGSIGEVLQGQMANVNIGIADGKPGRNASFNIRGMTSINEGDPLILIDGVPGGDINSLPPQDIESVSVLKDAASAAIYGGRATFGVILVTTKQAKKGKFSVDYSNSFSFSKPIITPDVYMGSDYMEVQEEFSTNINQTFFTSQQIDYAKQVAIDPSLPHAKYENGQLYCGGEVHNYYKEWFREYTPKQQHHLAISSGGEKLDLYTSVDYNHTEGPLKLSPTVIDKYYVRTNAKYTVSDDFSIFQNISFSKKKSDIPDTDIYAFQSNIFRFLDFVWPMMPEYVDVNGEKVATNTGWMREYLGEKSFRYEDKRNLRNTFGFDWSLFNDVVKIHGDYTYENVNWNKERFRDNSGPFIDNIASNRNNIIPAHPKFSSEYYRSSYRITRNVVNLYGSVEKKFEDHYFKGLLGFNQEDYEKTNYWAKVESPLNILPARSLSLGTGIQTADDGDTSNALRSAFFRLNYNFKERYLLELNGAYFLSSKFSKSKRSSLQPSVSAGWIVSNEKFFDPLSDVVNHLKLRASYGTLGNQNIGSFDYLENIPIGTLNYLLNGNTVSTATSPNPKSSNFTWEKVTTVDLGFDMHLLQNRITTTFDYYRRTTSGMLAKSFSLPSVFGAPVPKENNAELLTKGWEVSINYKNRFELKGKPFQYGFRLSVSDNTSEITKYNNPTGYLGDYYEGQKLGEIWGLTTLGLFKDDQEAAAWPTSTRFYAYKKGGIKAGDLKFADKNNDGVISKGEWTLADHGDYTKIGNETPRYQFGFTMNASWNNFDFNAFFNGVAKRDFYPEKETNNFWSAYNRKYSVLLDHVVKNSWTEDNPDAYFPRRRGYIAQGGYELDIPQTRYLQNGAYMRLKNLTVGYTLPQHISQKIKLKKLRVYFNGQNLWEISSLKKHLLDPEGLERDPDANSRYTGNGTAYSLSRVYSFGIQANF
ncbi:SusC/RagA family TonB-linked outer membrane protein [Marinifilum caeruleilacunae]|uniref:TonB-dependent receptor n=1 Tax=Marinifilum caeruleilacunae TaxID=2499076 RepID=A0ABX1WRJ2_9BACT|nr:TonB-dependent receptor [Marinifilum caeruleilacunae]NOU58705.1 TonB-dependent receptor [Marinifilum caeruleilacunae]